MVTEKERHRNYYLEHREELKAKSLERQKRNNYASEKTPFQRALRNIKRKTRYHFPFKNCKCQVKGCNCKATEHHHYTEPIEFDKYWNLCHKHHGQVHRGIKLEIIEREVNNGKNR